MNLPNVTPNAPTANAPSFPARAGLMQTQGATAQAALEGPTLADIAPAGYPAWVKALGVLLGLGLAALIIAFATAKSRRLR